MTKSSKRKRTDTTVCVFKATHVKMRAIATLQGRPLNIILEEMTEAEYWKTRAKHRRSCI